MKKFIALLLIAVMSLGATAAVSAAASAKYDVPTILAENGKQHLYLGSKPTTTPPTLDGKIGKNEYTISNSVSKSDTAAVSGTLTIDYTEYMAYDNDYIYYAIVGPLYEGKRFDTRIKPAQEVSVADMSDELSRGKNFCWIQVRPTNNRVREILYRTPSSPVFLKLSDGDVTFSGKKTGDNYTVELKISRSKMNEEYGINADDVKAYAFYTTFDEGAIYIGNHLTQDDIKALGNPALEELCAPKYMILADAPVEEAPTTAATTTVSPTTAATTTNFTTADSTTTPVEDDDDGCSAISLTSLAILPALACGADLVRKKKEI